MLNFRNIKTPEETRPSSSNASQQQKVDQQKLMPAPTHVSQQAYAAAQVSI